MHNSPQIGSRPTLSCAGDRRCLQSLIRCAGETAGASNPPYGRWIPIANAPKYGKHMKNRLCESSQSRFGVSDHFFFFFPFFGSCFPEQSFTMANTAPRTTVTPPMMQRIFFVSSFMFWSFSFMVNPSVS